VTAALARQEMGVAVLLVYGLKVPVPRDGKPGFRLTVQRDGAVWVQPVGFDSRSDATLAALDLQLECRTLGLRVEPIPTGFVVRRRPRTIGGN
jgi:hypothetical protein